MPDDLDALAKVGSDVLSDPAVREFLSRVTGEPASELGGLFADRIRYWRFRQLVTLSSKAQKLLDRAGLEAREVPPNVLVPLLERASLADDESLQTRWAALLANAAAVPESVPPSYAFILEQLTPLDARLLDLIFAATDPGGDPDWRGTAVNAKEVAEADGVEGTDFELARANLLRLRLTTSQATYGGLVSETILLTFLGHQFVRACDTPPASGA